MAFAKMQDDARSRQGNAAASILIDANPLLEL